MLPITKGCGEEVGICGVEAAGVIGDDVRGAWSKGHRAREVDLLPAAGCFIGESGTGKQGAGRRPQMAGVSAHVLCRLEETDGGDSARGSGLEPNANLDRIRIVGRAAGRSRGRAEQTDA
jgi:hypothetical protein